MRSSSHGSFIVNISQSPPNFPYSLTAAAATLAQSNSSSFSTPLAIDPLQTLLPYWPAPAPFSQRKYSRDQNYLQLSQFGILRARSVLCRGLPPGLGRKSGSRPVGSPPNICFGSPADKGKAGVEIRVAMTVNKSWNATGSGIAMIFLSYCNLVQVSQT